MSLFVACLLIAAMVIFLCLISDDFAWFLFTLLAAFAIMANIMVVCRVIFGWA